MLFAALKRHPRLSCVPHNESDPHPFAPAPLQVFRHYYG
jgi:hypothetical protein